MAQHRFHSVWGGGRRSCEHSNESSVSMMGG
jgi:hypothetical protein